MALGLKVDSLKALKNAQLHQIAVSIGAACSGTKPALVQAISKTLHVGQKLDICSPRSSLRKSDGDGRPLSLVSIDMGIRNLAYAHFSAATMLESKAGAEYAAFSDVRLHAWERLSVSATARRDSPVDEPLALETRSDNGTPLSKNMSKESFEPAVYAEHAVNFITTLVDTHQPTHILIERQRFRSSGQSAVQEWALRVGMFEGMLYAVLRTLASVQGTRIYVEGIQPLKVNRYWLQTREIQHRATGRALKKAKVDLVGRIIQDSNASTPNLSFESGVKPIMDAYLSKWDNTGKESGKVGRVTKLDDLADSLLQGLAWIHWQNRREELRSRGLPA